ncbi:hypothetical protein J7K44_03035, partial [bacterium]|nr:hypothetical protein [bacterium]
MSSVLLINQIIVASIIGGGVWLGVLVYLADRQSKINRLFCWIVACILVWVTFGFLGGMFLENPYWALLSVKINWVAVCLFFISVYFFSLYFPKEGKRYLFLDKLTIFTWFVFSFLLTFTDLILKRVEIRKFGEWGNEIIYGKGKELFLVATIFWTFLILFNLFSKYFTLSGRDKMKVQNFLVGIFLFALFNLIFNVVFPLFRGNTQYYQFGDYSATFIMIFGGLAIIKKQLFGVKVILVDLSVGLIEIILFTFLFFLPNWISRIVGCFVFGLYSILGYLLIRYTHREVRQKEILEEKVKERTKELQTAYEEIKKRKEDLEKFYKLTVGRELKMIELK